MKDYYQLTSIGKARRLRQLAIRALVEYNLDVKSVRLITNHTNGIFRVDTTDGQKYMLRVAVSSSGHSLANINSEMMFLSALADSDISAPQPIKTRDGGWVVEASAEGVPQSRYCTVFSWVSGVELEERLSPKNWRAFGELSANLHRFALTFQPPDDFNLPIYETPYAYEENNVLFGPENQQYFPDDGLELLQIAHDRIQADLDKLFADRAELRVVHGDLHFWNVLISHGRLTPIDFEDLLWGYPIQDVAVTLLYARFDDDYADCLQYFKEGYERISQFPEMYRGQLDLHMLCRRVNLMNYIFTADDEDINDYQHYLDRTFGFIRTIKDTYWS